MPGEWDEETHVRAFAFPEVGAERILVAEADPAGRRWLREVLAGRFWLDEVDSGRLALERLTAETLPLVIVGRELGDMSGGEMLALAAQAVGRPIDTFLLADKDGLTAEVSDAHARVFFRLVRTMRAAQVTGLFEQASTKAPSIAAPGAMPELERVIELAKRIGGEGNLEAAARTAIAAVIELLGGGRARCLYCDEESGMLWAEGEGTELDASAGLAGFAVRAVSTMVVPHANQDVLYRREIDDPGGSGDERLAIVPVVGLDSHVHAVLVAARAPDQPAFSETEAHLIEALATAWAPYLQSLVMRVEVEARAAELGNQADMFRQEAIQSLVRRGARGDVIRVHPRWIHAAYWLVLASVLGAAAFSLIAQVHQYAEGPAVIRFTGRNDVVAYEAGTIASLDVERGQQVKEGDVLVRMHDTEEAGRLRGLDLEFERKLVGYLQTPADPAVRQALSQIVSQRESAQANVESRVIRAPHAGTVKELMVRNGQRVESGKVVLSIVENGAIEGLSIIVFLPGSQRPRLHAHQPLHLTLPGYRGARISTTVRAISTEVLGANEAKVRYLGERVGDSLPISGTVVVVDAVLDSPEFKADGETYRLSDGMIGLAEVQLESHSVLETIMPGLQ